VQIELPANGWTPRPHQVKLWKYLEGGGTRAVAIWHRRAGKDDVALHWAAVASAQRVGNFWHMLPEASQARKAIWTAVNPHTGRQRIDEAFPHELRDTTKDQEMFIRFKNGSTWQVVGSDNYDSLVGAAPVGIVFSEWALANPSSWAFMRPILRENGGWAFFITTPRGRNHAASFYEGARGDPTWYAEKLSARDTDVFSPEQLDQELREYIREFPEDGEAKFQQEYECSFAAAIMGAYYGKLMQHAEDEGRIGIVPHNPSEGVWTSWDLGYGDSTVIWCAQLIGGDIRIIDLIAGSGVGIDWYVRELGKKPYNYVQHIVPHDADNGELGTGERRIDIMRKLGMKPIRVLPRTGVDDGIAAARSLLPRCRFNKATTQRGIEAMQQYRKKWDDKNKVFMDTPLHDWSSDYADSFRYLAMGIRDKPKAEPVVKIRRLEPQYGAGNAGWMGS
jgi:phage terminase large subunit